MYLFLKEVNLKNKNKSVVNELPNNAYEEVSTKYWNLIYKDAISEKQVSKKPFTLREIEQEFNLQSDQMFEFGSNNGL